MIALTAGPDRQPFLPRGQAPWRFDVIGEICFPTGLVPVACMTDYQVNTTLTTGDSTGLAPVVIMTGQNQKRILS